MHNKTFVVDGLVGIAGGRNIGDEYFDQHPTLNFRDRDVLVLGPLAEDMTANFEAYWDSPWTLPLVELYPKSEQAQPKLSVLIESAASRHYQIEPPGNRQTARTYLIFETL